MTFKTGTSGNPRGARPGPRFGRAALEKACRAHVAPLIDELVARAVEQALKGDSTATAAVIGLYATTVTTPANKTASGA